MNRPALTRSAARVSPFACVLAAAVIFLPGCDSADSRTAEAVQKASSHVAVSEPEKAVEEVSAVASSELTSPASIQAAELLGDAKMAIANTLSAKYSAQILDADRLISELQQLVGVMEVSAKLVEGYKKYDLTSAKQQINAFVDEASGKEGKATWIGEGADPIPTIAAAKSRISELQTSIAKREKEIESLIASRDGFLVEAGKLQEQSTAATGRDSVALYAQASAARKRASDTSTEIELVEYALAPLKEQLAIEQGRLAIIENYTADQRSRIKLLEAGAADRLSKVDGQRQVSQRAMTSESNQLATIATKAAELSTVLNEAAATREELTATLTAAAEAYAKAQATAERMETQLKPIAGEIREKDPGTAKAIDARLATFAFTNYRAARGRAELAAGSRHAAYASTLTNLKKTLERIVPAASAAGIEVPSAVKQLQTDLETKLNSATEAATGAFDLATEYTAIGAAGNDPRGKTFKIANIVAIYTYSSFLREMGRTDQADAKMKDVIALRDELVNDGVTSFPGLPSTLLPAPKPPAPAEAPASN